MRVKTSNHRDVLRQWATPPAKLLTGFGLIFCQSLANAQVYQGPKHNPFNGHAYYMLQSSSWLKSQEGAIGMGGSLAIIDDAIESDWIFKEFGGPLRLLWIGLTNLTSSGSFEWVSGANGSFSNWATGQPLGSPTDNFVYISTEGNWRIASNDGPGNWIPTYGMVEVVPEAPAWSLLLAGGLILARLSQKNQSVRHSE